MRAPRRDGASTRQAILDAAYRRVVEGGYANLNMRDIARDAGVNHALINYHFRSKQQLVLAMLDDANRRLLERQQRMYAQPAPASEKWRLACAFYEDDIRSGFVRLMIELMAASLSDEALRAEYLPRMLSWRRVVDDAVRDVVEQHGLELPVSPLAISTWIGCFWIGMEVEMAMGISERDGHHREALEAVARLLDLLELRKQGRAPARGRVPARRRGTS